MRTLVKLAARFGIVTLAGASVFASGCAEERDPLSHLQPNALPKSFFVGEKLDVPDDDPEFRVKSFTIDSSVGQSSYSIGEFTAVDRIRWEITETMLIARRAYQEVEGADNRGVPKSQWGRKVGDKTFVKTPNGTIVAAYKIESHFDVRRGYNPSTGEENNVLEENTTDRPWYQRASMRVDWSQNLVASTNDSIRYFGMAEATPVSYAVTDPTSEDAPHIELDAGYFDVTNKFTVAPEQVDFSWGSLPECVLVGFVTGSASYDCNPQEATVRMSFARIDSDKEDFESFEDTFAWQDVVGNWGGSGDGANPWLGAPRQKWDPGYGNTDAQTRRLKAIHEIWEKSHQVATCADNADVDRNGTADACENGTTGYAGHSGSQCDLEVNRCTIPVRDREVKTIGYFFNKEAPDALQDDVDATGNFVKRGTLEDLTYSWNQLLQVSVAYRREVECRRTKDGDRNGCHAEYFESDKSPNAKEMVSFGGWLIDKVRAQDVDQGKPVLTACHNPVRSYDPTSCGEKGSVARFGDIRKNFLVYWPFESRAQYGGVGANPPDPLTGQTFGATATIMGRSATYAAAQQRDILQLAMGDLSIEDLIEGAPAQKFASNLRNGQTEPAGVIKARSSEEIATRIANVKLPGLPPEKNRTTLMGTSRAQRAIDETVRKSTRGRDSAAFSASIAQFDTAMSKLRGTPFESQLADNQWMANALGVSPTAGPPNATLSDLGSPLRGFDPARIDAMRQWYEENLARKGACFQDSTLASAGSIYQPQLAGYFKAKYGSLDAKTRGEKIYDDLWKNSVKGIGLHELGHSLGLRHNFASSWDAVNYTPQYWQLRTAEGRATAACKGPRSGDDDSCMGPRYVDPMTADEQGLGSESRPGLGYYANTSTMEYQIERFGETIGLGTYDLHAMESLYGRVLEAFDDSVVRADDQIGFAPRSYTQLQEKDLLVNGNKFTAHYTTTARLANVFDPARDCRPATADEKAAAAWRVVHGKVCAPPIKDRWSWDDFTSEEIPGFGIDAVKWHAQPKGSKELIRWPYRFGEQYGAGGYMHTTMMDSGADIYELTQNVERKLNMTYPWTYFRRGRADWMWIDLPSAVSSQYFSQLRSYHWQIATDLGRSSAEDLADDDAERPYVMANSDVLRVLMNTVLTPEPGNYAPSSVRTPAGSGHTIFDVSEGSSPTGITGGALTIDVSNGRFIGEKFQDNLGGSWDYQQYVHHAGFEVEKALAMMQVVDPRPTLFTIERDNFLDGRNPYISFRTDLAPAVDRLLGGILAEDWETIAPSFSIQNEGSILVPLDVTLPAAPRSADAQIVFPNVGYKQQLSMAIYAALLSRAGSDMELVNKLRIWIDGDRAPTLPGGRQVKFTDPATGYTYIAGRFGDDNVGGKTIDRGIGSRMVLHANDLVIAAYEVKRDAGGKVVLDDTGRPEVLADVHGQPHVLDVNAQTTLRRYIGLVDAMRQIQIALGSGPLGGPED